MSNKELERYRVLNLVLENKLSQVKASELLNVTDREIETFDAISKACLGDF